MRVANGQVRTRTYVYDVPATAAAHAQAADRARPVPHSAPPSDASDRPAPASQPDPEPAPVAEPEAAPQRVSEPQPQTARRPAPSVASDAPVFPPVPVPVSVPVPAPVPVSAPVSVSVLAPEAVAVLAALRLRDPRLLLSERDVVRLAPAVGEWLRRGVGPDRIVEAVCADLPGPVLRKPAGLIAYRLGHLKPVEAAPLPSPQDQRPNVVPMQNCDACDRGYRAEHPGRCRDCATVSAAA